MDEENNNQDMRSEDLEQTAQKGAQMAGSVAQKVGNTAKNKAKQTIGNKINGARTIGENPNEKVGVAEKAKGKAIEAQGAGKTALGGSLTGAGVGARATGLGARAAAKGISAAGTLLGNIPYAGPAIRAALEASAKTMDVAGQNMEKFGKNLTEKGKNQLKSGLHDINRGRKLAKTGQDIGGSGSEGLGNMPKQPQMPGKPNIPGIVAREKAKAKKKKMMDLKKIMDPTKTTKLKIKLIILLVALVLAFIIILVMLVSSSINKGKYTEGDLSNVPYVVTSKIMNQIEIVPDNNGGYMYAFKDEEGNIVDINQAIDNALEILKQNDSTSLESMGQTDEERKELLKKLITAEVATQYPDISSSEQTTTFYAGDYCVDTSNPNSARVCNEEELIQMVNNSHASEEGKQNVLSVIPDLIEYQNKYNVNAVFAISVFKQESSWGTKWDLIDKSTYNWQSIKGSYNGESYGQWRKYSNFSEASEDFFALISNPNGLYFGNGNNTVKNIAPTYCGAEWGNVVAKHMSEFYASIGITDTGMTPDTETTPAATADLVNDGSVQGNVIIQRRNSDGTTTPLKYIDENSFNQLVVSNADNVMDYFTLKKCSLSTGVSSFGGTDILSDWIASWENGPLFLYKKGAGSYSTKLVKGYITEDGKYYICKTDEGLNNGTLNYGFGICVYNNGWMHTEKFSKYGVDVTQSVLNQSQVEVEIVDKVKEELVQEKYDYIKNKTESAGLTLSDNEISALVGIAYQFGDGGLNLDLFINLYKQYGNTEQLRDQCHTPKGTYYFKKVLGGTNPEGYSRAAANWELFHNGIYHAGSGGTLDKNSYSSSTTNGSQNEYSNSTQTNEQTNNEPINVNGSDTKTKCWNFLTQVMGYSDPVAAGIMGNIQNESSFNPKADNGTHYGIIQWSKKYCPEVNGKSLEEQFAYFKNWITSGEFDTYAKNYKSGFSYNEFLSMTDPGEAARAFAVTMERFGGGPNCTECNERARDAQTIFTEMGGSSSSTNNTSRVTSLDNFVFIGDSRYDGNHNITGLGNNIKNAGVGSSNINEWIKVIENGGKGTVQNRNVDVSGHYSGVSVQLGANGIYKNVANTEAQMKTLIEKLKILYPNTPIYINSCMQVSPKNTSAGYSWDASLFRDNITELNTDIANYCSQIADVYYIDISENLYDSENFIKDEYTSDGLHCNAEGSKVFAYNIKNAILTTNIGGAQNDSSATSNGNTYALVIANKTIVDTTVVETYQYKYSQATDTTNGSHPNASRSSDTPGAKTVNSSHIVTYSNVSVDYQTSLKPYTLYFDFLWALLINSQDRDFIMTWADFALNSRAYVTAFNEETSSESTNSQAKGVSVKSNISESGIYEADYYDITETTTVKTTNITSKPAITDANTWLIDYKNDAQTYEEYQSKALEQITEKIDPNEDGENIIKLLKRNKTRLDHLSTEQYQVNRMLEENEKVKFMIDTYGYILNIAQGRNVDENRQKLLASLTTSQFDLTSMMTTSTQKVLTYTSLTITEEDKQLLSKFVETVGEGCTSEEKQYITSVVLNRALIGEFGGNDVSKVIKKSHQFENFDASSLDNVEPSDETKKIVEEVITKGDKSNYSTYFATHETAEEKKWNDDTSDKTSSVKGEKYKYEYFTTKKYESELKKYEITVSIGSGFFIDGNATELAARMVMWAEQWIGSPTFVSKARGKSVAKNYCARFVMSAYDEVGLGYYGAAAAKDLPHPNPMKFNSDGTVDWSGIPVGAILVSRGTGQYGHVCLYIGNGYIIEAGSSVVKKSPIDESYGGRGHNCSPFLGWGFATRDQNQGYTQLVSPKNN